MTSSSPSHIRNSCTAASAEAPTPAATTSAQTATRRRVDGIDRTVRSPRKRAVRTRPPIRQAASSISQNRCSSWLRSSSPYARATSPGSLTNARVRLDEPRAHVGRQRASRLRRTGRADVRAEPARAGAVPVDAAEDAGVQRGDAVVGQRDLDRQGAQPVLEARSLHRLLGRDGRADERGHEPVGEEGGREPAEPLVVELHFPGISRAIHSSTSAASRGRPSERFRAPSAVTRMSSSIRIPIPRSSSGTRRSSSWK